MQHIKQILFGAVVLLCGAAMTVAVGARGAWADEPSTNTCRDACRSDAHTCRAAARADALACVQSTCATQVQAVRAACAGDRTSSDCQLARAARQECVRPCVS